MALFKVSRSLAHLRHSHRNLFLSVVSVSSFQSNPNNYLDGGRSRASQSFGFSRNFHSNSQFYGNFHSKSQFYGSRNSIRSIGTYQEILQSSRFSTVTSDEQGGESKISNGGDCSWIDVYLPQWARPYAWLARVVKPIGFGTRILLWPCVWSISVVAATGTLPDINMAVLFGTGALLFEVARMSSKPITSGVLTPFQRVCSLGFPLLLGWGILRQLTYFSRVLGASALLLVFSYPLMKRPTFWPRLYLGCGALLGWAAGCLVPSIIFPLYASGVFWTLAYGTIYAYQAKRDDPMVGVKSIAFQFGDSTKLWVAAFGIACVGSLALCGFDVDLDYATLSSYLWSW